jgi:hypothetical protein
MRNTDWPPPLPVPGMPPPVQSVAKASPGADAPQGSYAAPYGSRHPEVYAAYEAERTEKQRARWIELRPRYERASVARCRPVGKPTASEGQIGGLISRAFRRPRGGVLRADVLGALELGVSSAQASALILRDGRHPAAGRPPAGPARLRAAGAYGGLIPPPFPLYPRGPAPARDRFSFEPLGSGASAWGSHSSGSRRGEPSSARHPCRTRPMDPLTLAAHAVAVAAFAGVLDIVCLLPNYSASWRWTTAGSA